MDQLMLRRPTIADEAAVMDFRKELLKNGDAFHGCACLECAERYGDWLDLDHWLDQRYGKGRAPSTLWLAFRRSDHRLVGIIDYRFVLSDFMLHFGGHIGYSVRPSERRKGYGRQMLQLALEQCAQLGAKKVLLICDERNSASKRIIVSLGGQLENVTPDETGRGRIERYWITL